MSKLDEGVQSGVAIEAAAGYPSPARTKAGRVALVLDLLDPPGVYDDAGNLVEKPAPLITKEQAIAMLSGEV